MSKEHFFLKQKQLLLRLSVIQGDCKLLILALLLRHSDVCHVIGYFNEKYVSEQLSCPVVVYHSDFQSPPPALLERSGQTFNNVSLVLTSNPDASRSSAELDESMNEWSLTDRNKHSQQPLNSENLHVPLPKVHAKRGELTYPQVQEHDLLCTMFSLLALEIIFVL